MSSSFRTINSFILKNLGWGSIVRFIPGCKKVLILYAHRALFTADLKSGRYDSKRWEVPEDDFINYDTMAIEANGVVFHSVRSSTIYRLDLKTEIISSIIENITIERKTPISQFGSFIAFTSVDGIQIYSTNTNQLICSIQVEVDDNSKILFHPTGSFVLYMNSEKITAYRVIDGEKLWDVKSIDWYTRDDYWEFTPDGRYLIICGYEDCIRVYDSFTGISLATFCKGNDDMVTEAHLSLDGKSLISSSLDGKLRIWNSQLERSVKKSRGYLAKSRKKIPPSIKILMDGHKDTMVSSVSPNTDFQLAISFTPDDRTFYFWDIENGNLLDQISFEHSIDDFRIIWKGSCAKLFVAENSASFPSKREESPVVPPMFRISEIDIS